METKNTNKVKKIAIQGGYGAFHEMAAFQYFGKNIEIIPQDTFKGMLSTLKRKDADFGIMAIENTVAGSILPNYSLLREANKKIDGEIYLRIQQNLVALSGQSITDIKEVFSHPMAILQCQDFFEQHPHIRLIDSIDTALSAKEIKEKKLQGVGAIASSFAAKMYNLDILAESIESNKKNYTRFLILADRNGETTGDDKDVNKSSIHFALAHQIGSLSKILSIFSFYDINLSKIQSMPIIGKDWEYQFYIDLEFDNYARYKQSLEAVKPFTSDLGLLGEYKKGKSII